MLVTDPAVTYHTIYKLCVAPWNITSSRGKLNTMYLLLQYTQKFKMLFK